MSPSNPAALPKYPLHEVPQEPQVCACFSSSHVYRAPPAQSAPEYSCPHQPHLQSSSQDNPCTKYPGTPGLHQIQLHLSHHIALSVESPTHHLSSSHSAWIPSAQRAPGHPRNYCFSFNYPSTCFLHADPQDIPPCTYFNFSYLPRHSLCGESRDPRTHQPQL